MTMDKVIRALADAHIYPGSGCFTQDSEYGRAVKRASKAEEELLQCLDATQKNLLEHLLDAQFAASAALEATHFTTGYRLGVLLTTEVFTGWEHALSHNEP